jgi:hypothetical protein
MFTTPKWIIHYRVKSENKTSLVSDTDVNNADCYKFLTTKLSNVLCVPNSFEMMYHSLEQYINTKKHPN